MMPGSGKSRKSSMAIRPTARAAALRKPGASLRFYGLPSSDDEKLIQDFAAPHVKHRLISASCRIPCLETRRQLYVQLLLPTSAQRHALGSRVGAGWKIDRRRHARFHLEGGSG